ncbi:MAG: recombinase family protein [Ferrovum sp.]|nr:recombinase family protein [Ferrovum sp.]
MNIRAGLTVNDDYDDPAYSGGNMDWPALKRLMADIKAGKIDVVVIYKIDRLTRSLADFSKMVEVFERHGVSFVSVTQQFNTTTSMGRLMLNVLLSFAQFEREVTGERIRDKIAAAKRKGMWMGGVPPLGYDVDNRLLIINEAEAAVVRRIFEEMLTIGSPTKIAVNLTAEGITTKVWTTQEGQTRPGARIDKKYLHKLLRNRIYLGELSHKGNWYPGVHPAIIMPDLWGRVHEVLSRDGHVRSVETKTRSRTDALLRGLLYSPSGERMYPTYSRKDGRKYHYYVSRSESRFGASGKTYERLPALEIEAAIVAQIRTVLTSPESVASVVRHIQRHGAQIDEASTVIAMGRIDKVWDQLFSVERHRIANLMIERIDLVRAGEVQGIKVKWRELGWRDLIGEFMPDSIGTELVEMEGMA